MVGMVSVVVFGFFSVGLYAFEDKIVEVFTTNVHVEELAGMIWPKVALLNMTVAVFEMLVGVATGLGKQWFLGMVNFGVLWMFGLPVLYDTVVVRDGGLDAVWLWLNVLYVCMVVALVCGLFVFSDWYRVRELMLVSEGGEKNVELESDSGDGQKRSVVVADETTLLL